MSKGNGTDCLQSLQDQPNSQFNKSKILGEIKNYVEFYHYKHDVEEEEIFLGATVSSQKLMEICQNPTVTIILAKSGKGMDVNGFEEFKFIILGSDLYGDTLLERQILLPNAEYLDQSCCKRPKGGKGGLVEDAAEKAEEI